MRIKNYLTYFCYIRKTDRKVNGTKCTIKVVKRSSSRKVFDLAASLINKKQVIWLSFENAALKQTQECTEVEKREEDSFHKLIMI